MDEKTFHLNKLAKDSSYMRGIPHEYLTQEICDALVVQEGLYYGDVPEQFKNDVTALKAFESNANAIRFMHDELKTPERCMRAVEKWWSNLEFVPTAQKTQELCKNAVEKDGRAMEWVPEEQKTQELCNLAVTRAYASDLGSILVHIPDTYFKEAVLSRFKPSKQD